MPHIEKDFYQKVLKVPSFFLSVSDRDTFHSVHPDPDPFHETDPERKCHQIFQTKII